MTFPVTLHFGVNEFACKDGTPYPINKPDDEAPGHTWLQSRLVPLCETLEAIREAAGALHIDSGYRTLEYDERLYEKSKNSGLVAPASRSQHPKGRAADVQSAKFNPEALFTLVLRLYTEGRLPHLGGVGRYPNFVHIDVRPRVDNHLAIWGGARPDNIA